MVFARREMYTKADKRLGYTEAEVNPAGFDPNLDEEGNLIEEVVVGPQPGPQTAFLQSSADIVIYGGAAGGGKTWGLLFEPLRHIIGDDDHPDGVKGFTGVIFRREAPQVRNEGGLWDESMGMYPQFEGKGYETLLEWRFPGGQTIRFPSLQHDKDKNKWQGAQIPYIGFDELTHFTMGQFFYLMSRNRSTCGVTPYIRASCNPDADSWVAEFVSWWIDQVEGSPTYGLPLPDRIGKLRYFIRKGDVIIWADTPEELYTQLPRGIPASVDRRLLVKSVTFIPASIYDNKIQLEKNPEYLGNLLSLPLVERERLLGGNWKIKAAAGKVFNRDWWKFADVIPAGAKFVRYWDKAATDEDEAGASQAAFTAGVLVARTKDNYFYVCDCRRGQLTSLKRNQLIYSTAATDPEEVSIWLEQEPGSGGKESAELSIRQLAGFKVKKERVTGDKVERAMPASAQVEGGNVYIVRKFNGVEWDWQGFIAELHNFPDIDLKDQADAFSGAMNKLIRKRLRTADDFPQSSD